MKLKEGYCNYCKDGRMVEVSDDATQEQINEVVTEQCRCAMASRVRERRNQKEKLQENYPAIAKVFKDNIDAIQDNKIKKITINTTGNQTARMSKTKDGIKVELEKKQKNESLA